MFYLYLSKLLNNNNKIINNQELKVTGNYDKIYLRTCRYIRVCNQFAEVHMEK